jgi:nucleotide-binding universal stress UspA family protein
MFMMEKILVGVDGSVDAKKALTYAIELMEKCGGKITVINVYSTVVPQMQPIDGLSTPAMSGTSAALAAKMAEDAKLRGEQILAEAERSAKELGVQVEKVLREGDAVNEIVAEAKAGNFNLIVVGHRGMSKLREFLLGGVSEGISHKSPCPVLIVK